MKQKAEVSKVEKLAIFYKKYKLWIYLAAGGALLASWYLQGTVKTIFIALSVLLAIIFIKAFWELAQWLSKSKSGEVKQKRILGISITVVSLIIVYFTVRYLILPTSFGQSLQEFLYKMF